MCSYQLGAALAKGLFAAIGPEGTTALRLAFAAAMLAAIWRPWRLRLAGRQWRTIAGYGLALGGLNLFFYLAIRTVPLGVAVAIEFLGPLSVAAIFSRRKLDALWVALAGAGVLLVVPMRATRLGLDPLGLAYAAVAGVLWGGYIVLGRKAGQGEHGGRVTALGVAMAALVVAPVGLLGSPRSFLDPSIWPLALAVAVTSSALPNTLEMAAMKRLPTRVFGVLMSLEPALAALFGLVMLGERLALPQWAGIAAVMIASGGIALSARAQPE